MIHVIGKNKQINVISFDKIYYQIEFIIIIIITIIIIIIIIIIIFIIIYIMY